MRVTKICVCIMIFNGSRKKQILWFSMAGANISMTAIKRTGFPGDRQWQPQKQQDFLAIANGSTKPNGAPTVRDQEKQGINIGKPWETLENYKTGDAPETNKPLFFYVYSSSLSSVGFRLRLVRPALKNNLPNQRQLKLIWFVNGSKYHPVIHNIVIGK